MKSLGWIHLLICTLALGALPAFAESDVFGLGAGRDEALTVHAHESRVINSYAAVTASLNKGDHELRVDAPEGFAAGDLVMVLQTLGVGPVRASSVATFTFGPREQSPEGVWELARVARVRGDVLTLTRPLLNDFVPLSTQVIRVPEYTSVTIHPTGELKARSWNGTSGGVVAFLASGTLHNGGVITASGALLRQQPLGDGGVVFFRARKLTGAGRIEANGQALPWDLGTEGGGEGGRISARLVESADCEALMAQGGPGVASESFGAGEGFGPGAGGKVLLQAGTLTGCPVLVTGGENASGTAGMSVGEPGDVTLVDHALVIPRTPVITTPGDGQALTVLTKVVTGTGDPGATVFLRMSNVERPATPEWEFPATQVGASGDFSVRVPTSLDDGIYSLTAHAEFEGLSSLSSDPVYFTLESLLAPAAPVIQTPVEGASVGTAGTAFVGTAEANSTVTVRVDGTVIGTPVAEADGDWSLPVNTTLAEGNRTLTVTATDGAGTTGPAATRSFSVDKTAPIAPVIQTPASGALVGTAGTAFIGTAEANSTVTVRVDGTLIGTPVAEADGDWSLPVNTTLAEGNRTLTVTATDASGNTGPAATRSFSVDKTAPIAPVIQTPASGAAVGIAGTAFVGTAEANSTVTVRVDGTLIGTPVAEADGDWSLPVNTTLAEGARTMTVTATDATGNTGPAATRSFSVDKTAPIAPVIQTPTSGASVGIAGTAFIGTAEANSTVTVRVDGTLIGTPLAEGRRRLVAARQ
ncbi:Ig-like domain-containing protein, partial [Corallococcus terminator]